MESAERVDVHGGGGDLAAGCGGGDVESAEFGPGFDGCGEDGVLVSGGGGVGAEGVGPFLGLADVPAAGLPKPASRSAASTATGKRVVEVRFCWAGTSVRSCMVVCSALLGGGRRTGGEVDGAYAEVGEHRRAGAAGGA